MSKPKTIHLKLTEAEVQTVINGLSELPAKYSYHVINKIHAQAQPPAKPPVEASDGE